MLIVGTNPRGVQFAARSPRIPRWVIASLALSTPTGKGPQLLKARASGGFADFEALPKFLRKTSSMKLSSRAHALLSFRSLRYRRVCEQQGILIRFASSLFDTKVARRRVEGITEGDSLITHYTGSLDGWPVSFKRAIDIVAPQSLIFLSPVLLLTALVIKLTSPGPVMFVQKRLGLNKRHFGIYKFRTMVVDAEKRKKEIEHLNEVSGTGIQDQERSANYAASGGSCARPALMSCRSYLTY